MFLAARDGSLVRLGRYSPVRRRPVHVFHGRGMVIAPDGTVLYQDEDWVPNTLADEGEGSIINVYLREQANPSKYLALYNDTAAETDVMATMTEAETVGTDGYARQQILSSDWSAPALDLGDMQSSTPSKTFGPNTGVGSWTVQNVGIVTASSGTGGLLLAYISGGGASIGTNSSYLWTTTWKLK